MEMNPQDMKLYLVPGEGVTEEFQNVYSESYRMWKDVWAQTIKELDGKNTIYADDFSRQSLHAALFHKDECVAMTAFHFVDFNVATAADDSYFKAWTPEALQALTSEGKDVIICSHLTVSSAWRRSQVNGVPLTILICALSISYLMSTGYPVMTGTMRCNRGAHNAAYAVGGTPILKGATMHGVEVDLVGFYRSKILADPPPNHLLVQRLWNNRIELPKRTVAVPLRRAG